MENNSHTITLRVRYSETDQMGIVYYSNYLVWFEMARTEYFRARGVEYRKIEEEDKLYIPVAEAYCRYKSPLKYDDEVTVTSKLTEMSGPRMSFEYEVSCGGKLAATGSTKHAFVNEEGRPVPIPEKYNKSLK